MLVSLSAATLSLILIHFSPFLPPLASHVARHTTAPQVMYCSITLIERSVWIIVALTPGTGISQTVTPFEIGLPSVMMTLKLPTTLWPTLRM